MNHLNTNHTANCAHKTETREHTLIKCPMLEEIRQHKLIKCPMLEEIRQRMWNEVGVGNLHITNILDLTWNTEPNEEIESASQQFSYSLHCLRMKGLNALQQTQ